MRPRILISACALAALVLLGGRTHSPTTVTTTAAVQQPTGWIAAPDDSLRRAIADETAWVDGVAAGEAQQAADEQAAAAAAAQHPAPAAVHGTSAPSPDQSGDDSHQPVPSGDAAAAVHEFFGDVFSQAWGADDGSPYGVTRCESGHDPGAVSPGGGNWGLFQINTVHKDDFESYTGVSWNEGILNAHYNAMYARKLYDGNGGWGPWSCKWAAYR